MITTNYILLEIAVFIGNYIFSLMIFIYFHDYLLIYSMHYVFYSILYIYLTLFIKFIIL